MSFRIPLFFAVMSAAALTAVAFPLNTKTQETTTPAIKNVVFVHGAWADGSSWSKVTPLLEAKCLHVVAVQNPLTSFADDVAATQRIIDAQDGPVLLVGHSYGGAVITETGTTLRSQGWSTWRPSLPIQANPPQAWVNRGPTPGVTELHAIKDGFLVLSPKGVMEDFAPDLSNQERSVLLATQTPTQGAALGSSVSAAAWRTRPSWFVIASNDRMISPQQERDSAAKMHAATLILPTSHVPMLSNRKT